MEPFIEFWSEYYKVITLVSTMLIPISGYLIIIFSIKRRIAKIEKDKREKEENFLFGKSVSIKIFYYKGVCPECEGYGKDREPCPLCQDNKEEVQIPLKELLGKYPDFFLRHVKEIEMDSGEVFIE